MASWLPLLLFLLLVSCNRETDPGESDTDQGQEVSVGFGEYWYQGRAEISSFSLKQARYGEIREGEAVMIFVTEDLSISRQVKLDNPEQDPEDAQKVMKLNMTRKFQTGVYPYSIMLSVFSPVYSSGTPIKLTASIQEWCGHTFTQLNRRGDQYEMASFSYFEKEGDVRGSIPGAWTEDGIWNTIRLRPDDLPKGELQLIPSLVYARLRHTGIEMVRAIGSVQEISDTIAQYSLEYADDSRSLVITYATDFPHYIYGWKESYQSGWGEGAQILETTAHLKERVMLDYWNRNSVGDTIWSGKLGLD